MPTYTPIQSIQLTSTTTSVVFSGIPQIYQDLIVVVNAGITSGIEDIALTFNGDTGTNYSRTYLFGDGTTVTSGRTSNASRIALASFGSGSINGNNIFHVMNYSNSTTYKTVLSRGNNTTNHAIMYTGLWRSASAINSMTLGTTGSTWMAGSTFDLYGLSPVAAQNASAAGGTDIFYDSTYVYHVFKGSGTFTPYRNLTCDYVIVGGGGAAGSEEGGGGGGAGGLQASSSVSLTSGTSYAVTIGAGGPAAANAAGSNGSSSVFNSTTAGGGLGGAKYSGSGGNSGTPQSNTGGANGTASSYAETGGGGAGSGANGGSATTGSTGGTGGVGLDTYNSINFSTWLTVTGTGSSSKIAAGGGGGGARDTSSGTGGSGGGGAGASNTTSNGTSGVTNTGSGGGGVRNATTVVGGNGGSGLVIVRYAR